MAYAKPVKPMNQLTSAELLRLSELPKRGELGQSESGVGGVRVHVAGVGGWVLAAGFLRAGGWVGGSESRVFWGF